MQPVGPVIVGRIDVVRRADHPHAGVHRRLEQFARLRVVAVEAARLLGDDHVPPLGLDAGPDLIDPRAVGDLAADLGLLADLKRKHDAEDGDALRLKGAVAINRQDFGMTYSKDKIDDLVEVQFSVDTGR